MDAAKEMAIAQTDDEIARARAKCLGLAAASKAFQLGRAQVRIEQGKFNPGLIRPEHAPRKAKSASTTPRLAPRPVEPPAQVSTVPTDPLPSDVPKPQ